MKRTREGASNEGSVKKRKVYSHVDFQVTFLRFFSKFELQQIMCEVGKPESLVFKLPLSQLASEIVSTNKKREVEEVVVEILDDPEKKVVFRQIKELFFTFFPRDFTGKKKSTILNSLVYKFFTNEFPSRLKSFISRREEEKKIVKDMSHFELFQVAEMCGHQVPRDCIFHILSYMKHNRKLIFSLGLVNETFFIAVLASWKSVVVRQNNVYRISLLVLKFVNTLVIKMIMLPEITYLVKNVALKNITKLHLEDMRNRIEMFDKVFELGLQFHNCRELCLPSQMQQYEYQTFWRQNDKIDFSIKKLIFPNLRILSNADGTTLKYIGTDKLKNLVIVFMEKTYRAIKKGYEEFERMLKTSSGSFPVNLKEISMYIRNESSVWGGASTLLYPKNFLKVFRHSKIETVRLFFKSYEPFEFTLNFDQIPSIKKLYINDNQCTMKVLGTKKPHLDELYIGMKSQKDFLEGRMNQLMKHVSCERFVLDFKKSKYLARVHHRQRRHVHLRTMLVYETGFFKGVKNLCLDQCKIVDVAMFDNTNNQEFGARLEFDTEEKTILVELYEEIYNNTFYIFLLRMLKTKGQPDSSMRRFLLMLKNCEIMSMKVDGKKNADKIMERWRGGIQVSSTIIKDYNIHRDAKSHKVSITRK